MATPIDDDTLQRYYDGDLTPLEEHGISQRLEGDADAQKRLARLAKLSELFQESASELARNVDSQALFAGIEAQLEKAKQPGFGQRLRVITSEWVEHRRTTLVPLFAAGAVAAATLLVVLRPVQQPPESDDAQATNSSVPVAAVHGSQIENVDFGSSTGTVFEIEDRGVAVAVVWITEDEETP
jgi:anti-sigma factor RsiW